jgi:hypothetical protein
MQFSANGLIEGSRLKMEFEMNCDHTWLPKESKLPVPNPEAEDFIVALPMSAIICTALVQHVHM